MALAMREEAAVCLALATLGIEGVLQSVSRSAQLHHVHHLVPLWPPQRMFLPRQIVYLQSSFMSGQPEPSA